MKYSVTGAESLEGLARGTEDEIAGYVTRAIGEGAEVLKADWRAQIETARLGPRLARTIRSAVYPSGQASADAAGLVWTKAPKIIDSYARGATITARGGRFLAIPTEDVPRKRQGNALTPDEVEERFGKRLVFVSPGDRGFWTPSVRRNGVAFLVMKGLVVRKASGRWRNASQREMTPGARRYDKAISSVVMFILVPRVRVSKRLDLAALAAAAEARYPGQLTKHWR